MSTWRDRLTYEYRCPVIWAALNEIKSSYVEVMSPLLSRRVLDAIVALPDHLRDGRSMYREIIAGLSPPIGFAEHNAIEPASGILASPAVVHYLRASLDSAEARELLSKDLIDVVLQKIATSPGRPVPRRSIVPKYIKQLVPERMRMFRNRVSRPRDLDVNLLALRASLIVAMDRRMKADARTSSSRSIDP
ncbi:MAG: hypothetical protein IPK65_00235 [Gammaproteobacteria bacterium]|nr:hypothetical protein [Gammaproteobacteria bacterium]